MKTITRAEVEAAIAQQSQLAREAGACFNLEVYREANARIGEFMALLKSLPRPHGVYRHAGCASGPVFVDRFTSAIDAHTFADMKNRQTDSSFADGSPIFVVRPLS